MLKEKRMTLREINTWLLSLKNQTVSLEYKNALDKVLVDIPRLTTTCLGNILISLYLGDVRHPFESGKAANELQIIITGNGEVSYSWIDEDLGSLEIRLEKDEKEVRNLLRSYV